MRAGRASLVALICALALAACQAAQPQPSALPAGPQVVEIEMRDYSFHYDPTIASGRILFRVVNSGSVPHNLSLLPLSEDIPPIDEQLRGSVRRAISPFASVKTRAPGATTTFAVDLAPGVRYAFVCFVDGPDGVPHALLGMSSEFRTTASRTRARPATGLSLASHARWPEWRARHEIGRTSRIFS